ncbi:hypothetical protein CJF42_11175 [Pseudoalteromonas sp. NBT06-2]|uniref:hypothetical protein n=1 Tax=Pseudoalteromonas sp. NBT06-2 TaxID=2025950 RepID=UPI000BA7B612|nr:hypothetical protein [Pseudoalteromonas sp. NBT06-2]PAJ74341.1 hypothetical protein CJF42_11175 [Pseudoalteromonas sp. NBT06-2]
MKNKLTLNIVVINNQYYVAIPKTIEDKLELSSGDQIEFSCDPHIKIWKSKSINVPTDVFDKLMGLFKTEDYVFQWLNKKQSYLQGNAPISMLSDPGGKEAVLGLIERLEQGDFS